MSLKTKIIIFNYWFLVGLVLVVGCSSPISQPPNSVPLASQIPSQTLAPIPDATPTTTKTPILGTKVFIDPDELFAFPGLEKINTPNSADFCEHIPPPEVVKSADNSYVFAGRFSLCLSGWQVLVDTVMDLDQGKLVSADDLNGDIDMSMAPHSNALYYVQGLNNASIDEIQPDHLDYDSCSTLLQALEDNDRGVLIVKEGAIACVKTTEEQIALVRVDGYYPLETQGVGFSFAILKKEY